MTFKITAKEKKMILKRRAQADVAPDLKELSQHIYDMGIILNRLSTQGKGITVLTKKISNLLHKVSLLINQIEEKFGK